MKGNNELHLNEATMIEAVQFWINAQMHHAPRVSGVQEGKDSNYTRIFVVAVSSEAQAEAEPKEANVGST